MKATCTVLTQPCLFPQPHCQPAREAEFKLCLVLYLSQPWKVSGSGGTMSSSSGSPQLAHCDIWEWLSALKWSAQAQTVMDCQSFLSREMRVFIDESSRLNCKGIIEFSPSHFQSLEIQQIAHLGNKCPLASLRCTAPLWLTGWQSGEFTGRYLGIHDSWYMP